jgi:hypothetical protein
MIVKLSPCVAAALFFLAVLPSVFAEEEYGVIEEFTGAVYIKQTPGSAWEDAKTGMLLVNGALIETGFKSFADIFVSGTVITIRPLSRLTLEIPEYVEVNRWGEVSLPAGAVENNTDSDSKLVPYIPVGAGDNIRVKVRETGKTFGETMDGPVNSQGFDFRTPGTPRTVNVEVEILWP